MSKLDDALEFRTSRFLKPGEDRMVQLVQDTLRDGRLRPVDGIVADKIDSANRSSGSNRPVNKER